MDDVERSVGAWAQTLDAVIAIGAGLTDQEWDAATECPGWTVKDVYSHLIGGEIWMSEGHPRPENGLARIADVPVVERREHPGTRVLAELREVFGRRKRELQQDPPDPAEQTFTAYLAPVTVGVLLRMRAFDAWVHEQDIRRAIGRSGGLDTSGAEIAKGIFQLGLARVVPKLAGAPAGSSVVFSLTGIEDGDWAVVVDENGRGSLNAPTADPTVHMRMSWETFSRLAAGRIAPGDADIDVTGDRELADKILANFALTP